MARLANGFFPYRQWLAFGERRYTPWNGYYVAVVPAALIDPDPTPTPQPTPEPTPEVTPEATPEATLDSTPEATPEATLDSTPEATP